MKIEVTERGLKEIYGLKKVDETLTWRQITKKYSKKNEIRNHFNEWYQTNYQQRPPKATELYEQLEKNIGKQRNRAWYGYRIVYETYDSEDEEEHTD